MANEWITHHWKGEEMLMMLVAPATFKESESSKCLGHLRVVLNV